MSIDTSILISLSQSKTPCFNIGFSDFIGPIIASPNEYVSAEFIDNDFISISKMLLFADKYESSFVKFITILLPTDGCILIMSSVDLIE